MGISSRSIKIYTCDHCGKVYEELPDSTSEFFEISGEDTGHINVRPSGTSRHFSLCDEGKTFVDSLVFCSTKCLGEFVAAKIEQFKDEL